jgi:hypothetical protein
VLALGSATANEPLPTDPKLRALYQERRDLERRVEALKLMKGAMPADRYASELEKLVIELALKTRQIREIEGKAPAASARRWKEAPPPSEPSGERFERSGAAEREASGGGAPRAPSKAPAASATLRPLDELGVASSRVEGRQAQGRPEQRRRARLQS